MSDRQDDFSQPIQLAGTISKDVRRRIVGRFTWVLTRTVGTGAGDAPRNALALTSLIDALSSRIAEADEVALSRIVHEIAEITQRLEADNAKFPAPPHRILINLIEEMLFNEPLASQGQPDESV